MFHSSRNYKSLMSKSYVDYAVETGKSLLLATSKPDYWQEYLKSNHPNAKFKIVEHGIVINPKD